jgi:hypothetical protein
VVHNHEQVDGREADSHELPVGLLEEDHRAKQGERHRVRDELEGPHRGLPQAEDTRLAGHHKAREEEGHHLEADNVVGGLGNQAEPGGMTVAHRGSRAGPGKVGGRPWWRGMMKEENAGWRDDVSFHSPPNPRMDSTVFGDTRLQVLHCPNHCGKFYQACSLPCSLATSASCSPSIHYL